MNQQNPQQAAPVITPSELVDLIARSQSRGFTPNGSPRATVADDDGSFRPMSFGKLSQAAEGASTAPAENSTAPKPSAPNASASAAPRHEIKEPVAKPPRDFEAELSAAREAGRAEGHAAGRAEALVEAESLREAAETSALDEARDLFLSAAAALSSPGTEAARSLSEDLLGVIARLASDRAGEVIEDHPQSFLDRVYRLADRVAQGVRDVTVALHPLDLALVEPLLTASGQRIAGLKSDAGLSRGDVIVEAPGLHLADVLTPETLRAAE